MAASAELKESTVNIIAESTRLEGKMVFGHVTRVHGVLNGEIHSQSGSVLILAESAYVEGNIFADTLMIDGFVQGNIVAKTKVVLSRTGRVVGNIQAPVLKMEFGSYFEGRSKMGEDTISNPSLKSASP